MRGGLGLWRLISALVVAVAAGGAVLMAQDHAHGAAEGAAAAYAAANAAMHDAMAIEYSGDPDVDFARAMIPHHEGAIDMAEVLLANGKDPTLRQLAGRSSAPRSGRSPSWSGGWPTTAS